MSEGADHPDLEKLLHYLSRSRGCDFTGYKRSTLSRRILKRMHEVGLQDFAEYTDFLEVHPEEFARLFNTILINVTAFFRDPEAWSHLAGEILPSIVDKSADDPIRVWSAGCASGEEPYTLAMLLSEALGAQAFRQRVKIYATDIDEEALGQARQATYDSGAVAAVPANLREKYFQESGGIFTCNPDLRRSVIFGAHDVAQHAPISRLDLLVCRNTLMYFNAETQSRILTRFHFALGDQGFLFLGRAELLLTHIDLFRPVDIKSRIFAKVSGSRSTRSARFTTTPPPSLEPLASGPDPRLVEATFESAPWARLLIDPAGTLVLANHRARAALGLQATDVGRPFHDLELSYRPVELRSMIEQATTEHRVITIPSVEHHPEEGESQVFEVQVAPITDPSGQALGVTITFVDIKRSLRLQEELRATSARLETAHEELQSTNEELETTNEELQSTVEELETTNEELQSSNAELATMNEELQSSNAELLTLNDELRTRTADFDEANAFLESILRGLRLAVIVLDQDLNVHIWNRTAEDLWGLRQSEVRNQPFFALDIGLTTDPVRELVRRSVEERVAPPEIVIDCANRRGKSVRCRVTCTPAPRTDGQRLDLVLVVEELDKAPAP